MKTTALEKIVQDAKSVPIDPKLIAEEEHSVKRSLLQSDAYLKQLFGIEGDAHASLLKHRDTLATRSMELESLRQRNGKYPLVSLMGLKKHRTKEGWPSVAIFTLDSPEFKIRTSMGHTRTRDTIALSSLGLNAEANILFTQLSKRSQQNLLSALPRQPSRKGTRASISPSLPPDIASCYADVVNKLKDMTRSKRRNFALTARFSGLIPLEVKEKIAEAKKHFKQIFILAEPVGWSLTSKAIVQPKKDPLVVGWDGKQLYLIAEFDTTPVEEAILLEGPGNTGK